MKKVFVCSPYRGDTTHNTLFARAYCARICEKGWVPYAPHLLFPQFLNDDNPQDRGIGIKCGIAMLELMDEVWVFGEPTEGMRAEIKVAEDLGLPIVYKYKLEGIL